MSSAFKVPEILCEIPVDYNLFDARFSEREPKGRKREIMNRKSPYRAF